MEDKKILYVALALIAGITIGYMSNFFSIKNIDQGASARDSKVSDVALSISSEKDTLVNLKEEQRLFQVNCNTSSRKYVKVLSPNGRELYFSGQQITINWATCNYSNPDIFVMLTYYEPNVNGQVIATQYSMMTPNDGVQIMNLPNVPSNSPSGYPSGNYYKIAISDYAGIAGSSVHDFSDNFFTIKKLVDGCNSYLGFSTTTGSPCWIETLPEYFVTSNSAVLNGYLYSGTPTTISWYIVPLSGSPLPIYTATTSGLLSTTVTGLSPNTMYYFSACSQNTNQTSVYCANARTFTTLP